MLESGWKYIDDLRWNKPRVLAKVKKFVYIGLEVMFYRLIGHHRLAFVDWTTAKSLVSWPGIVQRRAVDFQ